MNWLLGALIIAFSSFSAHAGDYVLPEDLNVQMIVLQNPFNDFALRLYGINRAKVSLDVVTFQQSYDPIFGKPYIDGLNRKIEAGVKVRYVAEVLPTYFENFVKTDSKKGYLPHNSLIQSVNSTQDCPSKILCLSAGDKLFSGYYFSDYIHEKMLLGDVGTAGEFAFIGGRNNSSFSGRDIDFAVLFIRKDKTKPSAIEAFKNHYNEIFAIAESLKAKNPFSDGVLSRLTPKIQNTTGATQNTDQELIERTTEEYEYIKNVAFEDAPDTRKMLLNPTEMAITSNDFFAQLGGKQSFLYTLFGDRNFNSDNNRVFIESVRTNKVFRGVFMAPQFTADIEQAFIHALTVNDAHIQILLNGDATDRLSGSGGLQWLMSAPSLRRLEEVAKKNPKAKFEVLLLDLEALKKAPGFLQSVFYAHGKVALSYNPGDVPGEGEGAAFLGSENYNIRSTQYNSEMAVKVGGPEVVKALNQHLDHISQGFRNSTCNELMDASKLSQSFMKRILTYFMRAGF